MYKLNESIYYRYYIIFIDTLKTMVKDGRKNALVSFSGHS